MKTIIAWFKREKYNIVCCTLIITIGTTLWLIATHVLWKAEIHKFDTDFSFWVDGILTIYTIFSNIAIFYIIRYERQVMKLQGEALELSRAYAVKKDFQQQVTDIITKELRMELDERKSIAFEMSRIASFSEQSPTAIIELDISGNILYLNPFAEHHILRLREQRLSHPFFRDFSRIMHACKTAYTKTFMRAIMCDGMYFIQTFHYLKQFDTIRVYAVLAEHDIQDK